MIEDLFDEEILKPKKKKTIKPSTIILIAIILLIILCIATVVAIVYLKGTILTITLDGADAKKLENILIIEENNSVYMPIKKMAQYLGYDSYNGDYITLSEDPTQCYIVTEDELVSFKLGSNILTKVIDGQTQRLEIEEPIIEKNGELCITSRGAQDAFNLKFYYDVENNKINIQTLQFLYKWYSMQAVNEGYSSIQKETFANKTAILDNMLIVKSKSNYYGVITIQGEIVLETKYDAIDYLRKTSDFLVESNDKKGIISIDRTTKVEVTYDSITTVTNDNDISYVVGKSNLFGLLDSEGKTLIYPEYEQIGIDVTAYEQNGVTNGYIFSNKLIPVKRNNKWGLFDLDGNKLSEFVYDSLGCTSSKNATSRTYGVIQIPGYDLIIGAQAGKYNLITLEGKGSNFLFDSVYIEISEGKNIYYAIVNGETQELTEFLEKNGITKSTQGE